MRNKATYVADILYSSIDVLALQETWHESSEDIAIRSVVPPNFSFVEAARPSVIPNLTSCSHQWGGVAILFRKTFNSRSVNGFPNYSSFESVAVELSHASMRFLVVSVYRPGSSAVTLQFFTEFSNMLEYLTVRCCPVFILGDFNIHYERASDNITDQFKSVLKQFDFIQHVTFPTHRLGGVIDLVITKSQETFYLDNSRILPISDHHLISGSAKLQNSHNVNSLPGTKQYTARCWHNFDIELFRQSLLASHLCMDSEFVATLSVGELFDLYHTTITDLLDRHAPWTTNTSKRQNNAPWFDSDCRQSKRRVRSSERRYRKTRRPEDKNRFVKLQAELFELYHTKESLYWKNALRRAGTPSHKRWKVLHNLMCQDSTSSNPPSSISPDDFLAFFNTKIETIRQHTAGSSPPTYHTYFGPQFTCFNPVTTDEVFKLIHSAASKQCILDPAPTWLIKDVALELSSFLALIFNKSLSKGVVPISQKTAVIHPRLKKAGLDPHIPANYRPISNLTFISKLLEKLVDSQLTHFLHQTNAFASNQSAYLSHRSTETALVKIHSDLCSSIDSGKITLMGLLDLSAAFDTVDHRILLERLATSYGIVDTALQWISSYLSDRTVFILSNGSRSATVQLNCGVPQGSVLGPKLFLLYTKDVLNLINQSGFQSHGFADDTQLYCQCSSTSSDLHHASEAFSLCISRVQQWTNSNRLQLNPSKTECIWIRSPSLNSVTFPDITVCNTVITPADSVRCLGIHLDQYLTLDRQISTLSKTCFFQLRQLRTISKHLDRSTLHSLLQAFVSTRLDYCNSLYFGLSASRLDKLQRIQNSAARLSSHTSKFDHITPILQDLHWLPVSKRIEFKVAVLTYKSLHHLAPDYIIDFCSVSGYNYTHTLRSVSNQDLSTIRTNTTRLGNRTFPAAAAKVWNMLPTDIRSAETVPVFCRRLKTWLFGQSSVNCINSAQ